MHSLSILAVAGIAFTAAMAADFQPAPAGEPSAALTYVRGGPGWTELSGYDRVDCAKGSGGLIKRYGKGLFMPDKGQETVQVLAGRRLYLQARGMYSDFSYNIVCTNVASFTPQPGGRYEVVQEQDNRSCVMLIRDLDNRRKPPPDARTHPVAEACR